MDITKKSYESDLKILKSFIKSNPEALRSYVYALVDPRDNSVFYIGKGKDTRMIYHVFEALNMKTDPNNPESEVVSKKLELIGAIHNEGKKVIMYLLHWGMTDEHALIVESVLIDVFKNFKNINTQAIGDLTNAMNGFDARRGFTDIKQLNNTLITQPVKPLPNEKVLVIRINETDTDDNSIYQRVRYSWKLNHKKADEATYIAACCKGVIVGLYVNDSGWKPVPPNEPDYGRYYFDGHAVVDQSVRERYINKIVRFEKGASYPISYYHGW